MKELKQILSVLHSQQLEKLATLDDSDKDKKSLQRLLIEGVMKSQFDTDQNAANAIYGKLHKKHRFEILKSKVKQRAYASLLLYEIKNPEGSPRDAIRINLQKQLSSAYLLLLFTARPTGVILLKKLITQSSKYLLTDINIQALSLLQSHYWYIGDFTEHRKISKQLNKQLELFVAEIKSDEIYQSLTIAHVKSTSNSIGSAKKLNSALRAMKRLQKYFTKSYVVRINAYRLNLGRYQLNQEYGKASQECQKAIRYFNKDRIFHNDPLSIFFLLNKCEADFLASQPKRIFDSLIALRKLTGAKTANRVAVERMAFFANVYCGNYNEGERILKSTNIFKLPATPYQVNEWKLFDAFIELLKRLKHDEANTTNLSSILSSIESSNLSNDKLGANISLLVCEVICNILSRNHTEIMILDKKLDNYIYRYLNNDANNGRSVLFLKMLRLIIKEDYDKEKIIRRSAKYFEKIRNNNVRSFVEIVPYELLWASLLGNIE